MLYKSYPKINLYLHIIGKVHDYHRICSRFVLVEGDLYDEITITQAKTDSISGNLPCDVKESSIYRALMALRSIEGVRFPPVHIHVEKRIPSGAGLGGGSSNAGVVLAALIKRYGSEFTGLGREIFAYITQPLASPMPRALISLATSIGADVAFFVSCQKSAEVSGIGEEITPTQEALCDIARFAIYTPPIHCDTTSVYKRYAAITPNTNHRASNLASKSHSSILQGKHPSELNDLFLPACLLYPELKSIQQELGEGWFFSGSGSSFFARL